MLIHCSPAARKRPSRDFVAVGVGEISNFPGASGFRVIPFVAGRWDPGYVDTRLRGTALQVSVLPTKLRSTFFEAGPAARLRFGRTRGLDAQVEQIGRVGNAFELGGFVGVFSRGISHPGDELRVTAQAPRSGLPAFNAGAGVSELGLRLGVSRAFNRRWGMTVTGSGSRLVGDAADSPIVRHLGSRTQAQFGAAVFYRF